MFLRRLLSAGLDPQVWISKKIRDIGKYRLRACAGWYSVLRGESNVAIVPAIGGYGAGDIYLGEFSPQAPSPSQDMFLRFRASFRASGSAT